MTSPAEKTDKNLQIPLLESQLCFALYTATHRLTRAYRPLLEPLGLTYVQYLVMLVLWDHAPRSVGELGESLFLDSGTLTPLLKRMERAGLVVRRRDTEDERRVLIELTDQGRSLRERACRISDQVLCKLDLDRAEAKALRSQLMTLVANLDRHDAENQG